MRPIKFQFSRFGLRCSLVSFLFPTRPIPTWGRRPSWAARGCLALVTALFLLNWSPQVIAEVSEAIGPGTILPQLSPEYATDCTGSKAWPCACTGLEPDGSLRWCSNASSDECTGLVEADGDPARCRVPYVWPKTQRFSLSYCINSSSCSQFPWFYGAAAQDAMNHTAAVYSSNGGLAIFEKPEEDCVFSNLNVDVVVKCAEIDEANVAADSCGPGYYYPEFVSSAWTSCWPYCSPNDDCRSRIKMDDLAFWAVINYGKDDTTSVVEHEFGHVLGFVHEHNHPDASSSCWTADKGGIPDFLFDYDPVSIMHYASWDPACFAHTLPRRLSEGDKWVLQQIYPKFPRVNIISADSELCFGVHENEATLVLGECLDRASGNLWFLVSVDDNDLYFQDERSWIISGKNGKCLARTAQPGELVLTKCDEREDQYWEFASVGVGEYHVTSIDGGDCIGAGAVSLSSCGSGADQVWRVNQLGYHDQEECNPLQTHYRPVATLPTTCRADEEKDGLLCYPRCREGYNGVGPVCWEICPSGYTDTGVACLQNCRSGYTDMGLTCLKNCRSGYTDHGLTCYRNLFDWYFKSSYWKSNLWKDTYGRGWGEPLRCSGGKSYEAGLCYEPCAAGYVAAGPFGCWRDCDDKCPFDPNKSSPGVCGCGSPDIDTDNDGFLDCHDACPYNPWQTGPGDTGCIAAGDSDLDGIPDFIEITVTRTNPLDADTDDDGLLDGNEDLNHNGILDVGETDPLNSDTDGDGIPDGIERGLTVAQTKDTDLSKGHFRPDADPKVTTDPRNPDTDGDGLPDGAEDANRNGAVDRGETSPVVADSDGDGWTDGQEVARGTDPTDPASTPNHPPLVNDQQVTTNEDNAVEVVLLASDLDGDPLTFSLATQPQYGSLSGTAPNLTYMPNANYNGDDSFTYTANDGRTDGNIATVSIHVEAVNDPPVTSTDTDSQTVQYSDGIAKFTVSAGDVDSAALTLGGLPNGLRVISGDCVNESGLACTWVVGGHALLPAGDHDISITISDGEDETVMHTTLVVEVEDAAITWFDENPYGVPVDSPGGDVGNLELVVRVAESLPDRARVEPAAGDISLAEVSMQLIPVGPGDLVIGSCGGGSVSGTGYEAVAIVTCAFDGVPVNTYGVEATILGDYYTSSLEDRVVVYDPSLGFASGGGWFYWPGTHDKTNFGFTVKYEKDGGNPQGNLVIIRQIADGSDRRLKSTVLSGLSMGRSADAHGEFGWATFSGEATYEGEDSLELEGTYEFLAYLEDRHEPGRGMDRIWFWARKDGKQPESVMSMAFPAMDNSVKLNGGNLSVHTAASPRN